MSKVYEAAVEERERMMAMTIEELEAGFFKKQTSCSDGTNTSEKTTGKRDEPEAKSTLG